VINKKAAKTSYHCTAAEGVMTTDKVCLLNTKQSQHTTANIPYSLKLFVDCNLNFPIITRCHEAIKLATGSFKQGTSE